MNLHLYNIQCTESTNENESNFQHRWHPESAYIYKNAAHGRVFLTKVEGMGELFEEDLKSYCIIFRPHLTTQMLHSNYYPYLLKPQHFSEPFIKQTK